MGESVVKMAKRIQTWPLAKLKPYDRNPRTHNESQLAKIAASILEFGFTNPILVDSENGIIAGHGRFAAAQQLGLKEVPVIVLDHLSAEQRRAYVIADNRLALDAGWDEELLAAELMELEAAEFDLSLTGFEESELESLLADDDKEGIGVDPDEGGGVQVEKMTFGKNKVEITDDELEQLEAYLQQYVDAYGSTSGFASWLMEGNARAAS